MPLPSDNEESFLNKWVVHPLLFAAFPVLLLEGRSLWYEAADKVLDILAISCLVALVLTILLIVLLKSKHKAALLASVLVLWFYSWGALLDGISSLGQKLIHQPVNADILIFPPYCLLLAVSLFLIFRSRVVSSKVTAALNVTSLSLVLYNSCIIASFEWQFAQAYQPIAQRSAQRLAEFKLKLGPNPPDIYYVILDGCGRHDTFRDIYNYDNQSFISTLEQKGCFVGSQSCSNYATTLLSLGSSLNLEHVQFVEEALGKNTERYAFRALERLVEYNRVVSLLKQAGYKFINFPSGDGGGSTDYMRSADLNIFDGFASWFSLTLLQGTILGAIEPETGWLRSMSVQKRLCFFDHVQDIETITGPKFVFAHILLPHPPFVVDQNGKPRGNFRIMEEWWKKPYAEQVRYVEKRVVQLVYQLLGLSQRPLVLIMQGDHGPACTFSDLGNPGPTGLKERLRIFNCYYFPAGQRKALYPSITPVNSFRVLFNCFFGTQLPLKPDEVYCSSYDDPFPLKDVTDSVR